MGTRSITVIRDGGDKVCEIYRQYDGYYEGMGLDLVAILNKTELEGFNGANCLAATVIATVKGGDNPTWGNVYLYPPTSCKEGDDYVDHYGVEYLYEIDVTNKAMTGDEVKLTVSELYPEEKVIKTKLFKFNKESVA